MRVLRARGVESEAQIPFASLLELLRPALVLLDGIPRPQAAALESAFALRPGPGHSPPARAAWGRRRGGARALGARGPRAVGGGGRPLPFFSPLTPSRRRWPCS